MPTTIKLESATPTRRELPFAPAARAARRESTLRAADQPILSIRASVPKAEAPRFIAGALHDIRVFMQEHAVAAAGPPFSICRPRGSDLDIEAGWPTTTEPLAGTSRIHNGTLPRSFTGPRDSAQMRPHARS